MGSRHFTLTDRDRASLYDLVLHRAGIRLQPEQKGQIDWAIQTRLEQTNIPINSYLLHLREEEQEFMYFVDLITVQETYFLRYKGQFSALRILIQEILKERSFIRIWSAGCATGEEPYSIAMVAADTLEEEHYRVKIMASDISQAALEKARQGHYSERSVREVPQDLRQRYFQKKGNEFQVIDTIKNRVHFFHHNLQTDKFPDALSFIFCRNVTIYFPKKRTLSILKKFYQSLLSKGCLFTGHAESLFGLNLGFTTRSFPNCFFYQKDLDRPSSTPSKKQEVKLFSPTTPMEKRIVWTDRHQQEAEEPPQAQNLAKTLQSSQLAQLIEEGKMNEVITFWEKLPDQSDQPFQVLKSVGIAYANSNRTQEAIACLEKARKQNSLDYQVHYILSLLYEKEGDLEESLSSIKRALYLDTHQPMAHFHQGKLLEKQEEYTQAYIAYKNALVQHWQTKSSAGKELEELLLQKLFRLRTKERYG